MCVYVCKSRSLVYLADPPAAAELPLAAPPAAQTAPAAPAALALSTATLTGAADAVADAAVAATTLVRPASLF